MNALAHPKHIAAFVSNRAPKILRTQPNIVFSTTGHLVRWRLMFDEQQLETGTARNKVLARVEAQAAKRRVLSGRNWQ